MSNIERNPGYDYLRAVACAAIIFLHTFFSTTLAFPAEMSPGRTLGFQMVVNNLMWAVPCFIMVTGALLLPPEKEIGYGTLWKKYILRIVKALFTFGIAYVIAEMIFYPERRTGVYFLEGLWEIFSGDSWSHMWYLYCLIGLYILLPAYKMITARAEERDMRYLLIVHGVFLAVVPVLDAFGVHLGFYVHVLTIYPFWLFLGYYLKRWGMGKGRVFYGVLAIAATVLLLALTWARIRRDIAGIDQFFEYSSPLVIVQAAGIAGWFFHSRLDPSSGFGRVLESVNAHSFGIYLIHMMFVRLIYKHLGFDPFRYGGALGVVGVVLAAFVLSYAVDWVLKKLPYFKSML